MGLEIGELYNATSAFVVLAWSVGRAEAMVAAVAKANR